MSPNMRDILQLVESTSQILLVYEFNALNHNGRTVKGWEPALDPT